MRFHAGVSGKSSVSFAGLPPGIDPEPFEFTGELKATIKSRKSIKVLKIKPKGTLSMPFGHPIHPSKKGELDFVRPKEWEEMRQTLLTHLQKKIDTGGMATTAGVTFT